MGRDEPDASCIVMGKRKTVQTERAAAAADAADNTDTHRAKKKKTVKSTATTGFFARRDSAGISSTSPISIPTTPPTSTIPPTPPHPHRKTTPSPSRATASTASDDAGEDLEPAEKENPLEMPDKATRKADYDHRKGFACYGRPGQSCAADHPRWKASKALAYTFLTYKDCQYDEQGHLTACHLYCAWCSEKNEGWSWSLKGDSSTGNFINHFKRLHSAVWNRAQDADNKVLNPSQTRSSQGATVDSMFRAQVSLVAAAYCRQLISPIAGI